MCLHMGIYNMKKSTRIIGTGVNSGMELAKKIFELSEELVGEKYEIV